MFETKLRVAGVSFKNEDGVKRQDLLGKLYDDWWTEGRGSQIKVELRPEPDNEVDENAVAVYLKSPKGLQGRVGFVPTDQAAFVRDEVYKKRVESVEVSDMACGSSGIVSMELKLKLLEGDDAPEVELEPEEEDVEAEASEVEDEAGRVYDFGDDD